MKVACTVREGAVGKGPMDVGTSLAAYFISWESRPTGADRETSLQGEGWQAACREYGSVRDGQR